MEKTLLEDKDPNKDKIITEDKDNNQLEDINKDQVIKIKIIINIYLKNVEQQEIDTPLTKYEILWLCFLNWIKRLK